MKNTIQIKSIVKHALLIAGLAVVSVSCEEENPFDFPTVASNGDGIQNLDETGVDCGGSSGIACPTCTDGIQNQGEEGVDCGGPCTAVCPEATPRFDELSLQTALPYFHSFELAESGKELTSFSGNTVTLDFGIEDPAGGDGIVGRYRRPEGDVAQGFSDFKFTAFDEPINFSEFHKFTLDVYIPSSNNFAGNFAPTVELILHDNVDDNFWQRWTLISKTIDPSDFDKWITLRFDGTEAAAADTGVLLPNNNDFYDNITIRIGGSNHNEAGEFFVRDFVPTTSFVAPGTPRADAIRASGVPYFFTFESGDASSGSNLVPVDTPSQGVVPSYGVADPAGSADGVARIYRPENGPFGGFEDFKFQQKDEPIDFSEYHKFKLDVYVPSSNDFTGSLTPKIELIFHDNIDSNFWQRWTLLDYTVTEAEFDKWITIEFDATNAEAIDTGILLPDSNVYDNITLRFGGSNHKAKGEFFVKDFVSFK